jgi:methanogenic corrinoid protein MtbC1
VAQEHAVTGKVRAHLATLLAEDQGGVRGLAVLACAPEEQHDIGLTMLSVLLRADGWRVELLGADTPVDSAVDFAVKAGATMLCFSASRTESLDHLRGSLRHPAENGLAVVLGGAAARPEVAQALQLTYAGERLDEAVEQLRHLARA